MTLRKILFCLISFLSFIAGAQNYDLPKQVDSLNIFSVKLDSLKRAGIDTFLVYHATCYSDGYSFPATYTEEQMRDKECDYDNTAYVFYQLYGNTYVAKFNKCGRFSPLKITHSKSFTYYKKNYAALMKDTIKYSAVIDEDGELSWSSVDHSCYRYLFFSMKETRYMYIDVYWLNKKVYGGRNINYAHNHKTHVRQLLDLLYEDVEKLVFVKTTTTEPGK